MAELADARGRPRATINTPGQIVLSDLSTTRDVLIRDLSVRGACLCVGDWADVPNTFYLMIRGRFNPELIRRVCEKRWQVGDVVGVRFQSPVPEAQFDEAVEVALPPAAPLVREPIRSRFQPLHEIDRIPESTRA